MQKLPPNAPCFDDADLLIAANCTACSYGNFHHDFMQDKVTMTVPCCGGLSYAVKPAIENSGKTIPLHIVTISPDGKIIR